MPIARFQMPDGRIARFEVPEGTSPEQAQSMIADSLPKSEPTQPVKIGADAFPDILRQTLQEAPWGIRNIAGAGTALSNVWEGAKQFVGQGDKQRIAANKIIEQEAPVGAFAGNAALTAIPFAAVGTGVKAAGAVGAGYGALQPVEGEQTVSDVAKGKLLNTAIGGATGAAGQAVANKASSWLAGKTADMATRKGQNAVRDATLQEGIEAGYKVPPSMMPDSGVVARTAEGLSGKYKTNQLMTIRNQETTNNLAKQALGIDPKEPLSINAVERVREAAYRPYQEIANLPKKPTVKAQSSYTDWDYPVQSQKGFDPKGALENLKQSRSDAKTWFEAYNRSANPEQLATAKAYQQTADDLENSLETYAKSLGRPDLVDDLVNARKMIAKTYTVERAMKKGSGDVDAKVIGRLFEKRKPLSDGLDTIGKFGATYGDVAGIPKSGNASPFTALDFMQMSGTAPLGMIAAGNPLGALTAAALPLSRLGARYGLLNETVQRGMAAPLYRVPITSRMTGGLLNYSPVAGTALAVPAFSQ